MPPLGRNGLGQLVNRMGALHRGDNRLLLPENVKSFKHEDVRSLLDSHLDLHRLLKVSEHAQGVTQVIAISRPAFDHVAFLRTPEGLTPAYFSVSTHALVTQMQARGYVRFYVNHLGDDTHLPPIVATASASIGSGARPRRPSRAPPTSTLPSAGLPSAENKAGAESAADQVVREWELHVEIQTPEGAKAYYSPCYKWTSEARKAAKFGANQNDNFNQRAKVYCFLKSGTDEAAQAIGRRAGLGELKTAANEWANTIKVNGKPPKWADTATTTAETAASALD